MASSKKRKRPSSPKRKSSRKRPRFEQGWFLAGLILIAGLTAGIYAAGSQALAGRGPSGFSDVILTNQAPSPPPTPLPADWQPVSEYRVPILMYHHIAPMPERDRLAQSLTVTPEAFAKQLGYLKAHGYTPITFARLRQMILPPKPVILTFDDGYRDSYERAYPALRERDLPGVFYIVSGLVGDRTYADWNQLKEMQSAGMEMGAHTESHPDLSKSSPDDQRSQIENSIREIREHLSVPVITFAYPAGKWTPDTLNLVREAGMVYSVTVAPGIATSAMDQELLPRLRIENGTDFAGILP